jgi:uncharacterized membrane protein YkoI
MKLNRRIVAVGIAVAALAAGGGGIAYAVGGGSEQVTGSSAERAKAAALAAVGGGTVSDIERQDGDGAGAFEVEVRRPDGSQVEVYVGASYRVIGSAGDEDAGEKAGQDDD